LGFNGSKFEIDSRILEALFHLSEISSAVIGHLVLPKILFAEKLFGNRDPTPLMS
jgi:hypothetical protein